MALKSENYTTCEIPGLPGLMKMPLTEESKLLPSPGIYAVTAVVKGTASKAMAMILSI